MKNPSYAQTVLIATSMFQIVAEAQAINVHGVEPIHNGGIGFFPSSAHQLERRTHAAKSSKDDTGFILSMVFMSCAILAYAISVGCTYYCWTRKPQSKMEENDASDSKSSAGTSLSNP